MKVVYSYWGCSDRYIDKTMVNISHQCIKKFNYETILYVDSKNYHKFDSIKFDQKIILDQKILDKLPNNIWCLGKLAVFSLIKEPFVHIDFDLFMFQNLLEKFTTEDLFCFHTESWRPLRHFNNLKKDSILENKYPFLEKDCLTYNCAMIGGKKIDVINETANEILEDLSKRKIFFENLMNYNLSYKDDWSLPVFIEQILFMNICKYKLRLDKIPTIITTQETVKDIYDWMKKNQVYHLWGGKRNIVEKLKLKYN